MSVSDHWDSKAVPFSRAQLTAFRGTAKDHFLKSDQNLCNFHISYRICTVFGQATSNDWGQLLHYADDANPRLALRMQVI